jgi:hypothetical protein
MKRLQSLGVLTGLALLALSTTGCGNKPAQKTTGAGLVMVGTVVAELPHPYAKVAGATLIAAGTALIVEAEMADGTTAQYQVRLTDEQKRRIAAGAQVQVVDPKGKTTQVTPDRR